MTMSNRPYDVAGAAVGAVGEDVPGGLQSNYDAYQANRANYFMSLQEQMDELAQTDTDLTVAPSEDPNVQQVQHGAQEDGEFEMVQSPQWRTNVSFQPASPLPPHRSQDFAQEVSPETQTTPSALPERARQAVGQPQEISPAERLKELKFQWVVAQDLEPKARAERVAYLRRMAKLLHQHGDIPEVPPELQEFAAYSTPAEAVRALQGEKVFKSLTAMWKHVYPGITPAEIRELRKDTVASGQDEREFLQAMIDRMPSDMRSSRMPSTEEESSPESSTRRTRR